MLNINASNGPKIPALAGKRYFKSLNKVQITLPPAMVYCFSILVKVNLTPGSLSLIPISKWMQKYFYGDAKNSM